MKNPEREAEVTLRKRERQEELRAKVPRLPAVAAPDQQIQEVSIVG